MKTFTLSIKSKALIFVLLLIFIILLIINWQNNTAKNNFLKELESSYVNSFDSYIASFRQNIMDYYATQTILFNKKKTIVDILSNDYQALMNTLNMKHNNLKHSNYYLRKISFINIEATHIISQSEVRMDKSIKKDYFPVLQLLNTSRKQIIDTVIRDNQIHFRVLSGVFFKKKLLGAIEFLIDSQIVIENKNHFDGSLGFIYLNSFSEIYKRYKYKMHDYSHLFENIDGQSIHQTSTIKIEDRYYVLKKYALKSTFNKTIAHGIFFLDITDKKVPYENVLKRTFVVGIVLLLIAGFILNFVLNYLITRLEKSESNYRLLNKNLEKRVEEEIAIKTAVIKENEEKEKMLINQSKLASMGEMIANIAHQWKQPLTQMSAVIMILEAYAENDKLDNSKLFKKTNEANDLIKYMSQTIDDFRNFYKPDKKKQAFNLNETILKALSIVDSSLHSHNIAVDFSNKQKEIYIYGYQNEFAQAFLNVVSNAKDAIIERNINKPLIQIELYSKKEKIFIKISDNAGGINPSIKEKIFNPYFTTKHSSQGTGIGLYMTKMIIENNMQGIIEVNNIENGTCFTIKLEKGI